MDSCLPWFTDLRIGNIVTILKMIIVKMREHCTNMDRYNYSLDHFPFFCFVFVETLDRAPLSTMAKLPS